MIPSVLRLCGVRALMRLSVCASMLVVAIGFTGGVLVPWLGGPALFPADVPELFDTLWNECVRREAMDRHSQDIQRGLVAKYEVTLEVIAGRTSLAEATAHFRRLHGLMNEGRDPALTPYAELGSGDEAFARNVIVWVKGELTADPDRQAEVVARLERELITLQASWERPDDR